LSEQNLSELQSLSGVGPKTTDYLRKLVGIDEMAVDRHLKRFVARTGAFDGDDYTEIKNILKESAFTLKVSYATLDRAIWQYESSNAKRKQIF
jgi:endonuclease III